MPDHALISVNGTCMRADEPCVCATDPSFVFGWSVFDTLRVYTYRPFLLERHVSRLLASCHSLEIAAAASPSAIKEQILEYIREASLSEGLVRTTIALTQAAHARIIITSRPLPYTSSEYARGFQATVSSIRRNETSPLTSLKTGNFMENMVARRTAQARGYDESLFLNSQGYLTEGTMSNLFFFNDKTLCTPSVECGLLAGITREFILHELSERLHVYVQEGLFQLGDVLDAHEAFLCNSAMEIMPLVKVERTPLADGKPGRRTGTLLQEYARYTGGGLKNDIPKT